MKLLKFFKKKLKDKPKGGLKIDTKSPTLLEDIRQGVECLHRLEAPYLQVDRLVLTYDFNLDLYTIEALSDSGSIREVIENPNTDYVSGLVFACAHQMVGLS